MRVPGGNLLVAALRVIQPQAPQLLRWTGRTTNAARQQVSTYAPPVAVLGSFQPVDQSLYAQLGLDLDKTYSIFYTPVAITVPQRGEAGDRLIYAGSLHEAQSEVDWQAQDGWRSYTFVRLGVAV